MVLVHTQNGLNGLILNWWLLVHSSPASLVDRRKDQLGDSCGTVAFCSERKALRCRLLLLLQYETGDFAVARKWLRRLQLSQMDPEEAHIVIATAQNTVWTLYWPTARYLPKAQQKPKNQLLQLEQMERRVPQQWPRTSLQQSPCLNSDVEVRDWVSESNGL